MELPENPYAAPGSDRQGASPDGSAGTPAGDFDLGAAPIEAEGALTWPDYREACRLSAAQPVWRRFLFPAGYLILAGLCVYRFYQEGLSGIYLFGFVVLIYAVSSRYLMRPVYLRRYWNRATFLQESSLRRFGRDGMQVVGNNSENRYRWAAFAHYQRSEKMLLLYFAEQQNLFLAIPRHTLASEQDWQALLKLVDDFLPRG